MHSAAILGPDRWPDKDALAWLWFTNLDAQQAYVRDLLQAYEASTLQSLTSYR